MRLPEGSAIKDCLEQIQVPVNLRWTVTSVNGVVKDKTAALRDGDLLLVVPAGGGG